MKYTTFEKLEQELASRDAEVVSLTNQRDYEYVRAENAEQDKLLVKIEIAAKDAEIAELVAALRLWELASSNSEESELDDMACYCVPMPLFCDAIAGHRSSARQSGEAMKSDRELLELAAKACGFKKWRVLTSGLFQVSNNENWNEVFAKWTNWNPLTNPADTAEMCAKLLIDTCFYLQLGRVTCDFYYGTDNIRDRVRVAFKDHDNSRMKAWMYAATMVAAKIGEYTE